MKKEVETEIQVREIEEPRFQAFGEMIYVYDSATFHHSMQTAVYAKALANLLHLPPHEQSTLVQAAQLHDIGKLIVPRRIVDKPAPLTGDEFEVVKRHSLVGAEIVRNLKDLESLSPVVAHHHERWDGAGYPNRLAGEEIPLAARIIALADSVDALCSTRPYRQKLEFVQVMEEIGRCSGRQFDPEVVAAFFELAAEKGAAFFRDSAAAPD